MFSILELKKLFQMTELDSLELGIEKFQSFGNRGGGTPEEAFEAWKKMIKERLPSHIYKFDINNHPKYISSKIKNLNNDQFGYNMFGQKYPKIQLTTLLGEIKKSTKIFICRFLKKY